MPRRPSFTAAGKLAYLPTFGGFRAGPCAGISYGDPAVGGLSEAGGVAPLAAQNVEDWTGAATQGGREPQRQDRRG